MDMYGNQGNKKVEFFSVVVRVNLPKRERKENITLCCALSLVSSVAGKSCSTKDPDTKSLLLVRGKT